MEESAKLRPILAAYAFEIFREAPLSGVGFGQYQHRNVDFMTQRTFDLPMEKAKSYIQHNVFLSLLTETGLLGLVSFVMVLCFWIADSWGTWTSRHLELWQRQIGLMTLLLLVAYLSNAMFHELSLIAMVNSMVFFVAGLLRSQQESRLLRPHSSPRRATDLNATLTSGWSLG